MGEYRSLTYLELALFCPIDLVARQIRGEEIRGERYPTRIESEHSCKSPDSPSLAESRNSLEESVSSSKKRDNQLLDHRVLPDDIFLDISFDLSECIVDMCESRIHE